MTRLAVALFSFVFIAAPLGSEGQQVGNVPHVAVIRPGPAPDASVVETFKGALLDLGYAEGRNVIMVWRFAAGKPELVPGIATELIQLNTNVIVTFGDAMTRAVHQATTTIPIVAMTDDLLASGLVASLARPGGNVTGVSIFSPELNAKRLELLKEVVPHLASVVAVWDPSTGTSQLQATETAAKLLGLRLRVLAMRARGDLPGTFEVQKPGHREALNVLGSPFLFAQRTAIIDFAAKNHLPSIFQFKEAVDDGGLLSYGSSRPAAYRAVAGLIDKILKGAKPGDLPVEQPTKFELIINLKTAKALGLTIPQSVLARADEVIE